MKYIKTSLLYTVYLFASSLIGFAVMWVVSLIINSVWSNPFVRDLLYILGMVICSGIVLYVVMYRNGYKDNNGYDKILWKKIYITIIISLIIALILNIVLFFSFIFDMRGPTSVTLALLFQSGDFDPINGVISYPLVLLSYILMLISCVPFMAGGYYSGYKKRGKDRDEIKSTAV